jgi:CheY-like chemotaxis protein
MRPNFILMDVQMPVMNGLEATSQIRQWESAQGLPRTVIIGLTAGVADGDKGKCINSGMDDVLFKPVDLDELEEKIVAWTSH